MLRVAANRRRRHQTLTLPAAVGGLNARDPIASMPPTDAVVLDNWFPRPSFLEFRKGFVSHATGLPSVAGTIVQYRSGTVNQLFAATATAIYNVTSAAPVGAAVQSGLGSSRWQWTNVATSGGQFMYMVNGVDSPRLYDGTTWTAITGVSTPAITGVTTSLLSDVVLHKTRLWFVEINTMRAWFLPASSVGGAASSFDFGPVFRKGGALLALGSWSIDAGEGLDDHFVAVTTQGQVVVYKGTDPASAATWARIGTFDLGTPIGQRCLKPFGGDLLYISQSGIFPLSAALQSAQISMQSALTDKIRDEIARDTLLFSGLTSWELIVNPQENMLMLNVPTAATTAKQYAMNTITGAWCRFTGQNANTWGWKDNQLFFAEGTTIWRAWTGFKDNTLDIIASVLPAFNDLGMPANYKHVYMVRPVLLFQSGFSVSLRVNTDYNTMAPVENPAPVASSDDVWDTGLWDTALWGAGDFTPFIDWRHAEALGYEHSLYLKLIASGECRLANIDYLYEVGAPIG